MECQVVDCDNQAEPGGLLCRQCREKIDREMYGQHDDQSLGPETIVTIWGEMEVGGEG